jgi:hypothetical protein
MRRIPLNTRRACAFMIASYDYGSLCVAFSAEVNVGKFALCKFIIELRGWASFQDIG